MNFRKRWYVLLAGILIVGCSKSEYPAVQKQESPREIFNSVQKKYDSLQDYTMDLEMKSTIKAKGHERTGSRNIYLAKEDSTKYRYETKNTRMPMKSISDGNTEWVYLESKKEYTQKNASPVKSGTDSENGREPQIIKITKLLSGVTYPLADSIVSVTSLGKDTLMINDKPREAIKLKVRYKKNPKVKNMDLLPATFWIDSDSRMVLKRSAEMKRSLKKNDTMNIRQDVTFNSINLSPRFADSAFTFVPPADTKKVDTFRKKRKKSPLIGKDAVGFKLSTFDGKQISLADYKGKVVVLDFWATWCGPCRKAHPTLQKVYADLKDEGLVVLGINDEKKKKVKAYMKKHDYTFTNLKDATRKVGKEYGVRSIPTVFIINKKGKVSQRLIGYKGDEQEAELRDAIRQAGL